METLLSNLKIQVNSKTYLKDPESSELGRKIIENSILLIHEIGFEEFTFKKLGIKISSNESSIYRYFENKHKLLIYLSSWYWGWIEYKLVMATSSIDNRIEKLKKAIVIITQEAEDDYLTPHINEKVLFEIIIDEFLKTLHNKQIDSENNKEFYQVYKRINYRIQELIEQVNPTYPYSKNLAVTIIEGAMHQHFLKKHLKTITNCTEKKGPTAFFIDLTEKTLNI